MHSLRRHFAALVVLVALVVAPFAAASTAEAQVTRTRAIILSFEGWNADPARAAVENGLAAAYDVISEQQAVDTAVQMGVDPSTPDGLGAVVARLHIELVIGGSVSGTGRRAQTTIWVTDTQGNQLATRTAGSPSGRGFEGELASAALQACGEAVTLLRASQPATTTTTTTGTGTGTTGTGTTGTGTGTTGTGTTTTTEPAYDPDYDIENEVAGRPRGQHGHEREHGGRSDGADRGSSSARWNQPVFRALVGLDIRNTGVFTSGGPADNNSSFQPELYGEFFPLLGLWLETRPFAQQDDALRGLYAYANGQVAAGYNYISVDSSSQGLTVYNLDLGVGYAGTIGEVFELAGTIGFAIDGISLSNPIVEAPASCTGANPPITCANRRDFPGVQAYMVRLGLQPRVRLAGDLLILEGGFGGRIVAGWGSLAASDLGAPQAGGGFDWFLGLAGIIDPGFTWMARFGYSANYITFGEPAETFPGDRCADPAAGTAAGWCRDSGLQEAWHFTLGIGWAFR